MLPLWPMLMLGLAAAPWTQHQWVQADPSPRLGTLLWGGVCSIAMSLAQCGAVSITIGITVQGRLLRYKLSRVPSAQGCPAPGHFGGGPVGI